MDKMDAEDWINRINYISYDGNLQIAKKIQSVNCKEWEEEKKIIKELNCNEWKKIKKMLIKEDFKRVLKELDDEGEFSGIRGNENLLMATRYYVKEINDLEETDRTNCLGHIDFRPEFNTISDAFLPIPQKENFFVTCKKPYKIDDPFNPVIITVPYIMADPQISLCSPATLWILLATLSTEFRKENVSLYDIIKNLPPHVRCPSSVAIKEYSRLFEKHRYSYHIYIGNKLNNFCSDCIKEISASKDICEQKECRELLNDLYDEHIVQNYSNAPIMNSKELYSYIESEIPVYLTFQTKDLKEELEYLDNLKDLHHSVVAIGYTLDENNSVSHFIVHDVSFAPFVKISKEFVDKNLVDSLVVLPEDIHVRFENCEEQLKYIDLDTFDESFKNSPNVIIRSFLMSSQRIKFWFTKEEYPSEVREIFSKADFPKFVWMFEINPLEMGNSLTCKVQIIFNATLTYEHPNPGKSNNSLADMGVVLVNSPKFSFSIQNGKEINKNHEVPICDSFHIFKNQFRNDENLIS